jgi:ssDNA-binding Zn-finger/Zn-ribbon topoisomerase 1
MSFGNSKKVDLKDWPLCPRCVSNLVLVLAGTDRSWWCACGYSVDEDFKGPPRSLKAPDVQDNNNAADVLKEDKP